MSEEEIKHRAVIYCDGSAYPNPGYFGDGIHGYIYDTNNLGKKNGDKPSNYLITNIGYLETNLASKTEYQTVIPKFYINGYVSHKEQGSNNKGEVNAIIKSINYLIELKIPLEEILIKSDSTYAIGIFKKILEKADWRSNVNKNVEYWEAMEEVILKAVNLNINLSIEKVLGHSTSLGNNIADRLAFLGRYLSTKYNADRVNIHLTEAIKYWKPTIEKHPMLPYRQLFFLNTFSDKALYTVFNYKSDVEPGKKSHEASFGLVMPTNKIDIIENVIEAYLKTLGGVNLISTINLDVLYTQFSQLYMSLFGNDVLIPSTKGRRNISVLENEPLCYEVYPPGLANKAMESVIRLTDVVNEYRGSHKGRAIYTNITDMYYKLNDKNKLVISIDNITKSITIDYTNKNNITTKIPLEFGRDIIPRNSLKKLEKLEPKITLVTYELTDECIEYYIIVETLANSDLSIWCNIFSNTVFLPKKK